MQVIPHVTNEIKDRIYAAGEGVNVLITEIGGTIEILKGFLLPKPCVNLPVKWVRPMSYSFI